MIAVTGRRTTIVQELEQLVPAEQIVRIDLDLEDLGPLELNRIPPARRYVLAAGLLHQKRILEQSAGELVASLSVNLVNTVRVCEAILTSSESARICVIGSLSAIKGSHDQTYAIGKAALMSYVRMRKVGPQQQLAIVLPPIISDSGMTRRRHDYPEVLSKRHTVTAAEVARLVKTILFEQRPGRNSIEHMLCP